MESPHTKVIITLFLFCHTAGMRATVMPFHVAVTWRTAGGLCIAAAAIFRALVGRSAASAISFTGFAIFTAGGSWLTTSGSRLTASRARHTAIGFRFAARHGCRSRFIGWGFRAIHCISDAAEQQGEK